MPNTTAATRILRDDLLAQLRSAQHPLTTAQLRHHATYVPVAGARRPLAPIREQIYRVLCALERAGLVTRGDTQGHEVTWTADRTVSAAREIAALAAAFNDYGADHARAPELSVNAAHRRRRRRYSLGIDAHCDHTATTAARLWLSRTAARPEGESLSAPTPPRRDAR